MIALLRVVLAAVITAAILSPASAYERERYYYAERPYYYAPPPAVVYQTPIYLYPSPPVVYYVPPPIIEPYAIIVRPSNCGRFRYWNGSYCADARKEPPYVGPRW